jgi:hypothetical protein
MAESNNVLAKLHDLLLYIIPQLWGGVPAAREPELRGRRERFPRKATVAL